MKHLLQHWLPLEDISNFLYLNDFDFLFFVDNRGDKMQKSNISWNTIKKNQTLDAFGTDDDSN